MASSELNDGHVWTSYACCHYSGAVSLSVSFSRLCSTDPRFTRGGAAVSIALSRGATKDTHSKLAQLNKTYFKLFIWK